jgi:hypothetical protein
LTSHYPAVIIDGAVPRSEYERCIAVFDYLITLPGYVVTDKTETIDPGHERQRLGLREDWDGWTEWENTIIDEINAQLPDDFVCTVGEAQPGDVIVREVGHPDDEMEAM